MIWTYIIIAVLLLAAELIYFRIADKRNIIDKPNERSSHKTIVNVVEVLSSPLDFGYGVYGMAFSIHGYWLV